MIWLYVRDYANSTELYKECEKHLQKGLRVFIQGYSAMDCREYKK